MAVVVVVVKETTSPRRACNDRFDVSLIARIRSMAQAASHLFLERT